jgi:Mitotic checkpoint protein
MKRTAEEMNEPPSSASLSFLQLNASSNNRTILHQQQQIESLQIELDHEREKSRLDQKKSKHSIEAMQEKLSLLKTEMKQMQTLFDETSAHNEKRIHQLSEARDKALHMNRQFQIQIECMEEEQCNPFVPEDDTVPMNLIQKELKRYKVLNDRLNEQIRSSSENELAYQTEISNLKSTVQQKLLELEEKTAHDSKKHPLLENAPPSVLQELNRCRMQLANRERQIRQLEHSSNAQIERCNALLHENEIIKIQLKRFPVIQSELQVLHQQFAKQEAELNAWNEFSKQMTDIMVKSPGFSIGESSTQFGPPEITTILRFIERNRTGESSPALQSPKLGPKGRYHTVTDKLNSDGFVCSGVIKDLRSWELRLHESKTQMQTMTQKYELAHHQKELYQREIESYKYLIETYEKQIRLQLGKNTPDVTEVIATKQMDPMFEALRIQVESTSEQLKQLQKAYDAALLDLQENQTERGRVEAELDRVRTKYGELKDAFDSEKERRVVAEERAVHAEQLSGKGSFDENKTRILHLTETPLVEALKEEVQVLKRQLDHIASSASSSSPSDASAIHSKNTESVVTPGVPNPEKLIQRLKENFKEQIGLFREGVYLMTGYKVDMLTSNADRPTFRLRSVYAENEDDQLLFQWPHDRKPTDSGHVPIAVTTLDLLHTDLAKVLATTPSYEYMSKFQSMPAFLASVQLNLFEKQTVMM